MRSRLHSVRGRAVEDSTTFSELGEPGCAGSYSSSDWLGASRNLWRNYAAVYRTVVEDGLLLDKKVVFPK